MNTFAVERGDHFADGIGLNNFTEVLTMSLQQFKDCKICGEFINAMLDATDDMFGENTDLEDTTIVLVGADGYFIWGVKVHESADGTLLVEFYDWKDKKFRFVDE